VQCSFPLQEACALFVSARTFEGKHSPSKTCTYISSNSLQHSNPTLERRRLRRIRFLRRRQQLHVQSLSHVTTCDGRRRHCDAWHP